MNPKQVAPGTTAPAPVRGRTIMLSDVHLRTSDDSDGPVNVWRQTMTAFVAFLRGIDSREVGGVIVLGDLFDFWFEYKHVVFSGYFDVLRAFADLADRGVRLDFVCGNHDFWAGRFLEKQVGFHIHPEPVVFDFGGRRVLVVHGDGLNPRDVGYRAYKWLARSRPVVWLFRLLHPDWAMALARVVSSLSRGAYRGVEPNCGPEVSPLREFARRALAAGDADVVICGHSHHPVSEELPTPHGMGLYLNTGGWLRNHSYAEWDGNGFALRQWSG